MTRKEYEAQYNHEQFLKALKRNAVRCYQCNVVRGWPVELVDCREPKNLTLGAWSFPGVWCGRMVVRVAVRVDTTLWCGTHGSVPAPSRGKKRPKCVPCRTSSQAALTLMLILSVLCLHNEQQLEFNFKAACMNVISNIEIACEMCKTCKHTYICEVLMSTRVQIVTLFCTTVIN